MSQEQQHGDDNTISLAEKFAYSTRFRQLFADGMNLVEQSASWLDGPGRAAAKTLPRSANMLFGSESMRMTTRLMQLASWLLLQRAANEGEMTREQMLAEKTKVRLESTPASQRTETWDLLPADFIALVDRSLALQNRILSLDGELYGAATPDAEPVRNPVNQQIDLLSTAFGAVRRR